MVRRTLAFCIALLAVAAFGAAPAQAGGPTSVVLSSPPKVVAIGYEDSQYDELQRLTDVSGSRDPVGKEQHEVGRFVRATWLIHDMSVWRIDIIYPDAPGGPWIATRASLDGSTLPEKPVWHTATDRVALLKLLGSMKLLDGDAWGGPTESYGQVDSAPAAEEPPPAAAVTETTGFFTGWRWTIPGFLLGAVAAVVAVRMLPRRRDWQLVDAE
ncbi:hypothetical protein AB0H36_27240 [Kribbella sp. NPDC050820]|uniref:hypothetical protein n=1 Tax=Kribbella sp. NPDC050820 TaxID=3155408 RepID=UPI0033D4A212